VRKRLIIGHHLSWEFHEKQIGTNAIGEAEELVGQQMKKLRAFHFRKATVVAHDAFWAEPGTCGGIPSHAGAR
jgi:hypothetical protein